MNQALITKSEMKYRYIFISIICCLGATTGWSQEYAPQQNLNPAPLLFEALKEEKFSIVYKKIFEKYLGLKWVAAAAGPTSPAERKVLKNGDVVYLYSTCRPHACDDEYLSFVYMPLKGRGWGLINIKSNTKELAWINSEIEEILVSSRGLNK